MASPFPGMNPYLEQDDAWHSFHNHFITLAMHALVPQVAPDYFVKMDEHIYIHELPADDRMLVGRGDVFVARPASDSTTAATVTIEAPAYGQIPEAVDIERQDFLEIRDRRSRDLVTVIELLSPCNKRTGPDREQYLAKRRRLFASSVHLVEIDLLRGSPRLPIHDLPSCDYYIMVSEAAARPNVAIWPLELRDPLPAFPIPLRPDRPTAKLNLMELLHQAYDAGGYQYYIYTGAPQPALHPDHNSWAQALVEEHLKEPE